MNVSRTIHSGISDAARIRVAAVATLLCLLVVVSACRIVPLPEEVIGGAKTLTQPERATITAASGWSGPCIRLQKVSGRSSSKEGLIIPYSFTFKNPDLSEFRVVIPPGPVELEIVADLVDSRTGVLKVNIEAKAGRHYLISGRYTKQPDGLLSWNPVTTEK